MLIKLELGLGPKGIACFSIKIKSQPVQQIYQHYPQCRICREAFLRQTTSRVAAVDTIQAENENHQTQFLSESDHTEKTQIITKLPEFRRRTVPQIKLRAYDVLQKELKERKKDSGLLHSRSNKQIVDRECIQVELVSQTNIGQTNCRDTGTEKD